MKTLSALVLLMALTASGQGTMLFDQQSSINESIVAGGPIIQQRTPPYGQSFTPSLSGVGFIRLSLFDYQPGNGVGATLYVNLRSDSIGGTILGSSTPVSLLDGSATFVTFQFNNQIPVTPGTIYYFQPVVQSGGLWGVTAGEYNYAGGSVFDGGFAATASDYWFREGINVPEPSSVALMLLAGGTLLYLRRGKLL